MRLPARRWIPLLIVLAGTTAWLLAASRPTVVPGLRADPGEAYNVASRHPDVVAAALAYVENWEQDYLRNPRGWR